MYACICPDAVVEALVCKSKELPGNPKPYTLDHETLNPKPKTVRFPTKARIKVPMMGAHRWPSAA